MNRTVTALVLLSLIAPAALAAKAPKYFVDPAKLPFNDVPGISSERSWGVLNGAGYRIEVPDDWNGSLVLWAHGYRGTGLELIVDNHPLRTFLIANGYAWAASSYGKNGYDALGAAKDTHTLRSRFIEQFGMPSRIYVTGASLGGHVTALMAERWPSSYSGAVSACGAIGDAENFDFYLDFNVAAQTLSGIDQSFPFAADYLTATVPATKAALGPAFPFVLNASGTQLAGLTELRSGGVRPLFDQGWLYWNGVAGDFLFGLGKDALGFNAAVENADVTYQFDVDPALSPAEVMFNGTVQRISSNPTVRRKITPTTGNLGIPMLTLATLGDLFVPFVNQQIYAERVAARGKSDLLVQRAMRDFGHCTFTPSELVSSFVDLVEWVNTDIAPAGDDVLDVAGVADPSFGCEFTDQSSPRLWDSPGLAFLTPEACPAP